ncbi:histidine kinase [Devosia limi DSM 17137]|uniref:histidine kinase n=1 Tax=Devosia limi DSM 17137 TaxID=1121477 RepID=A0A0F5LAG7_9HYPH|nr:sensor histidine kinase KdpD [Devosia limi]KKB79338.1 histidine kinase [Devosia limi DSM 17137]SHF29882.1 two-component system, OmpR family, sensor histidine kinase KdpD [Devosia limi DSM 17137]
MTDNNDTLRPDPAALLELAARETRGKLTIFLGAAPGVGKTYAMLTRARQRRAEGVEIVIGLVETHGRAETAALLEGLEILPRRAGRQAGRTYDEFDLDAALRRKPAIIIVDELAHSNDADARHPKRYQDIAELLAAGIDVWTALNVQHLESLSDLVARIAGVPVRETVPDIVLQKADEVVLVDLPPSELIARLREGKVYLPENAGRAAEGFFKPANLTALRELALRRTADRVDDQMADIWRQQAVEGPWTTGERLLVCVGPDQLSEKVVRTASRLAVGLNARWIVLSLSGASNPIPPPARAARLEATLHLAERLGAEIRRATVDDFVAEILRIARRENITQIVVGRPRPGLLPRRSLPEALLRAAGDIGVYMVPGQGDAPRNPLRLRRRTLPQWALTLALPFVATGLITVLGLGLSQLVALQNLSMLFLVAVLVSALLGGRFAALLAAGLSFLAYNFFFIDPVRTFTIARPHEVLALAIFVGVAVVTGSLAARLREQMGRARQAVRNTQALYDFSRKLSAAYGLDNVLTATAGHLQTTLGLDTVLLASLDGGELELQVAWPPDQNLDATAMTAARWAHDKREPAGFLTATLPAVPYLFLPIRSEQRLVGVVGLKLNAERGPLTPDEGRQVAAILEQAAIAIDRARLVRDNARIALEKEGEKLQTALLSSLSHDLRTPLASITGAVTTLRQLGDRMNGETRADLLMSIEEETGRLNRFVTNLFDMTRIESGAVKPRRDPVDLLALITNVVERARALDPALVVETSIADAMPPVLADPALLDPVLFNLLDNARKYAGTALPVTIFVRVDNGMATIAVTDQGKGIPPGELEAIFDKFYRRAKGDHRAAGTGLGLSIARGFVEAMGGTLKAESPAMRRRGTRFTIRLPLAEGARS